MHASGVQGGPHLCGAGNRPTPVRTVPRTGAARSRRRCWQSSSADQAVQAQLGRQNASGGVYVAADMLVLHPPAPSASAAVRPPAPGAAVELDLRPPSHSSQHAEQPGVIGDPVQHSFTPQVPQAPHFHIAGSDMGVQEAWSHQPATGNNRVRNAEAHLMGMIKQRATLEELRDLLQQYDGRLNLLHASAACTHAAQLLPRPGIGGGSVPLPDGLLDVLLVLQSRYADLFGGRQVANSLWAMSKLWSSQQQGQQRVACTGVLHQLLRRLPAVVGEMRPQEVANTWYALGALRASALPPQLADAAAISAVSILQEACWEHWGAFRAQELSSMLWGAAHVVRPKPTVMWAGVPVSDAWLEQLVTAHTHVLHELSPLDKACGLWSLSQLVQHGCTGLRPGQFTSVPASGRGGVLTLPHALQSSCDSACMALASQVHALGPAETAQALSALAHLPRSVTRDTTAQRLAHRAAELGYAGVLGCHAACVILHAAAQLHLPCAAPGQDRSISTWTQVVLQPFLHPPAPCIAHDLTTALHALVLLGCQPGPEVAASLLAAGQRLLESGTCTPHQQAGLLWMCARLSLLPPATFMAAFQKASYGTWGRMGAADIAAMFWSLGRLSLRPGRKWMAEALACVWQRRAEFHLGQLLQILSALGQLQYALTPVMCEKLAGELQQRCGQCEASPEQLVALLAALARVPLMATPVVRWVEVEVVGEHLQPAHIAAMAPGASVTLLWACARLARRLPSEDALPQRKLHLAPPPVLPEDMAGSGSQTGTMHATAGQKAASGRGRSAHEDWVEGLGLRHAHAAGAGLDDLSCQAGPEVVERLGDGLDALIWEPEWPCDYPTSSSSIHSSDSSGVPVGGGASTHPDTHGRPAGHARSHDAPAAAGSAQGADGQGASRSAAAPGAGDDRTGGWQSLRRRAGRLTVPAPLMQAVAQHTLSHRTELAPHQVAALLFSLPALNMRPPRGWVDQLLFVRPQLLPRFTPHDLALTLFALGCMRMRPSATWMRACLRQVQHHARDMNTSMVSGVLRGLSLLDASPGPVWLARFVTLTAPALALMPAKQLEASYQAATNLEPQLCQAWGPHFQALLDPYRAVAGQEGAGDEGGLERSPSPPAVWGGAGEDQGVAGELAVEHSQEQGVGVRPTHEPTPARSPSGDVPCGMQRPVWGGVAAPRYPADTQLDAAQP